MDNRCVCCGAVIPEGRMVCPVCERMKIITREERAQMINWKVRIRNKLFWVEVIPAIALVIQAVAAVFGWAIDLTTLTGKLIGVVDAVFALLVILGVVVDPTTAGVGDSKRAMEYTDPWKDGANE